MLVILVGCNESAEPSSHQDEQETHAKDSTDGDIDELVALFPEEG